MILKTNDRTDSTLQPETVPAWFPVDNAGNLYAAARRRTWNRTFRVAAVLDEEIRPDVMQQALDDTAKRMPTLCAKLHDGVFWSYFERTDEPPLLQKEAALPFRPIPLTGTMQPNFRVQYHQRRVSFEVCHAVCDCGTAFRFLNTLITRYYELQGVEISDYAGALCCDDTPTEEETADAYLQNADASVAARSPKLLRTYFIEEPTIPRYANVIHGVMRVDDVKAAAAKYALTITEYFASVMIFCFISIAEKPIKEPVRISIPIDLRNVFPSKSIRNFPYMFDVSFAPDGRDDVAFSEICAEIAGQIREKSEPKALLPEISANVSAQTSPVLRRIPYALKRLALKSNYQKSQISFTSFLSNYGVLHAPKEILPHLERAEFVLGDTPYQPFGAACASVNDILTLSFNANHPNMEKQQFIFRFLSSEGIPVRIESNFYE